MSDGVYCFGPTDDICVDFKPKAKEQFMSYAAPPNVKALMVQLVCHAILQMSEGTNGKRLNGAANNVWVLKCVEQDNYIRHEVDEVTGEIIPVKRTAHYTFPIYDLIYEGSLVFSMKEGYDSFTISFVDFERLNDFIDSFLDSALEHASRFGRRG